jgi:hypothetical protein
VEKGEEGVAGFDGLGSGRLFVRAEERVGFFEGSHG